MNLNQQKNSISILNSTIADYQQIKNLLHSVDLPIEGVLQNITNYLLLFEGRQLIGTVGLEIYGKKALLRSLAIASGQQGNGYGQKLCHRIIMKAKKLKISELYLLTEGAEGFFNTLEFRKISRELVDNNVKSSLEFQSLCPESATCMILRVG